jgi:hypothetical protein
LVILDRIHAGDGSLGLEQGENEIKTERCEPTSMSKHRNVTFGVAGVIFALCLSSFGLSQQSSKRARAERKTNSALGIQVAASRSLVKLPPSPDLEPLNCEPTEKAVVLLANAASPHRTEINFTWQVPVGRLVGQGREVTWDLSGVKAGTYTATVEASDKLNHSAKSSISVTVEICPGWRPDPPPCPVVMVSCPSAVDEKTVTFVVTIAGADPAITPTYKWSVSAGKIVSGQGTSKVTVDASETPLTATVSVGGFNPSCATLASCTVGIVE